MPTKPNRAGQQQNYVPQGNGDASGEYADEATGSNIHFTNFKKPDEQEPKKFDKFSKGGSEEFDLEKAQKTFKENLASRFNTKNTEAVEKAADGLKDSLNDEALKLYNDYFAENQKLKFEFGGAGRNAAGCATGYSLINTNSSPHTLRHEIGHTFDNFYGKDLPKDEEHHTYYGSDRACNRFVDSEFGVTMNEMLHEELSVHNVAVTYTAWRVRTYKTGRDSTATKNASMQKIADIYNRYCDKIYDEATGIANAREKYLELYKKDNESWSKAGVLAEESEEGKAWKAAKQKVYEAQDRFAEEMRKQGKYSWYYQDSPEVMEARRIRNEAEEKMSIVRDKFYQSLFSQEERDLKKELFSKMPEVGKRMKDIACIVGDVSDYLNVASGASWSILGHGNHYFKERYDGGFSMEIFANMFSSYSSKNSMQTECLKEMFPQSFKIFEKIYHKQFN